MAIDTQIMTADELLKMPHDNFRFELVRGELIQMSPAGSNHGKIAARIGSRILQFVEEHNLGDVYAAETGFIIDTDPDTVRAPDASFVTRERIDALGDTEGFFPGAPDLAIEVISPNDTYTQVADKALEWLRSGTQMVIVIDPNKKTVTLYRDLDDITILTETQTIEGGNLLPGWSLSLQDLFK
jgi:Uma2 family endonuclease